MIHRRQRRSDRRLPGQSLITLATTALLLAALIGAAPVTYGQASPSTSPTPALATPTASVTPTRTATAVASATATSTPSATAPASASPTRTPSPAATTTPTSSPTATTTSPPSPAPSATAGQPTPSSAVAQAIAATRPEPGRKRDPRLASVLEELAEGSPAAARASRDGPEIEGGRVRVTIVSEPGQVGSASGQATSLGGTVVATHLDHVDALVPVGALRALSQHSAVRRVQPPIPAHALGTGEGVALINAPAWHSAGLTGAGTKIGIIDLGFQGYSTRLGSELPASVNTSCSPRALENGEAHGTAVAEIVHEVAPGAQLYLVAVNTATEMGSAVSCLAAAGVTAINHSVGWLYHAAGDGTGYVNQIVNSAVGAGIFWANSAGNAAQNHWSGPWSDPANNGLLDFVSGGDRQTVSVQAGSSITVGLRWNESWTNACNDYDLYLLNAANAVVARSENVQNCATGSQPLEWLSYTAPSSGTYYIVVSKWSANGAHSFDLITFNHALQVRVVANSLLHPADSASSGMASVGATYWNNPTSVESFSSQGPTTDGRIKPDLNGPDGVSNTVYDSFFGTSAASPHVAAAAALVKHANPSYGPSQIKGFLVQRAVDIRSGGADNESGSGRLSLGASPQGATATPVSTATSPPTVALSVSPASATAGSMVTVSWSGRSGATAGDWVGLYQAGAADGSNLNWFYAGTCSQGPGGPPPSAGSCSGILLPGSLAPGTYEFRYFTNTSLRLGSSNAVTVTGTPTPIPTVSLSVSPASAAAGGMVSVSWSGRSGATAGDWIGLYQGGTTDGPWLNWFYAGTCSQGVGGPPPSAGSCSGIVLPGNLAPGTYEFRYFTNTSVRIGISNALTIVAAPTLTPTVTLTPTAIPTVTVNVSPASTTAGSGVTVSWSGRTGATSTDWVGFYRTGEANGSYLVWFYAGSCAHSPSTPSAAGSCPWTLPGNLSAGTYEFRFFAANSTTLRLGTSNTLTITTPATLTPTVTLTPTAAPTVTVNANPASTGPGSSVTVSWSGRTGATSTDWVGLFRTGTADGSYLAWFYAGSCAYSPSTPSAAGSCPWTLPGNLSAGTYEFRFFAANSTTLRLGTSNTLTVGTTPTQTPTAIPGLTVSVNPSSAAAGSSVTVSWNGRTGATSTDWIGLYRTGAAHGSYLAWFYTSSCAYTVGAAAAAGSCPLTLPGNLTSGTYELRLFAANSFDRLGTSNTLTVP